MNEQGEQERAGFGASGGRWRGVVWLLPLAVGLLTSAAFISLLGAVSRRFREGGMLPWMRSWGHVPLWALGVRLDVRGLERRDAPGAKIVVFNHASLLDLFVLAALCPPRPIVLYKKELGRIPGLGWALSSLGMVSLDRSNHVAAIQSVAAAGERMRAEGASLIMAPEGTRSRRGGLQAFKLGAFHLATSTGVPLTPMILRGTASVLPMGSILARSGVVRVDFLASIESDDWRVEDVRAHAAEVREVFLGTLASEMP